MKNNRQTNIELLRIIAMFMIVSYHMQSYVTKGDPALFRLGFRAFAIEGGGIGVGLFLIISSWFIDEKYSLEKAIKQGIRVELIAVEYLLFFIITYIAVNVAKGTLSFDRVAEMEYEGIMMPLWLDRYWYVTGYVLFIVISPQLYKMFNSLGINNQKWVVIVLSFVMIINPFGGTDTIGAYMKNLSYIIYIFFVVQYLKAIRFQISRRKSTIIAMVAWVILNIGNMLHSFVPDRVNRLLHATIGYTGRYQILQILIAVMIFYFFKQTNIKQSKRINNIAGLTFGVYLFHNNDIFDILEMAYKNISTNSNAKIVYVFLAIVAVYICGTLFEMIREFIFSKIDNLLSSRISKKIVSIFKLS